VRNKDTKLRLQETKHYQITRNGKASTKSACHNKKATQIYLKNMAMICTPQQGAADAPAARQFAPVCGSQKTPPGPAMALWRQCAQTARVPWPLKKIFVTEAVSAVEVK
jgi:hypothetical protein